MSHQCLDKEDSSLAILLPAILQTAWANTDLLSDFQLQPIKWRMSIQTATVKPDIWNSLSSC